MRGDKPKGWTPLLEEEFQAATKPAGWTQADEEAFQAQFGPSAGQYALQGLESVGQGIAQAIGDVAALPGEVARLAGVPAQVAGMVPGVGDLQDLSQGAQAVQGAIPNVTAVQAAPDSAAKFLATSGASAVGQVLPTLGTMGIGKAAGLGSRALAGLGAGVGAAQGAVQGSQEAAAAGASKPEQWGAFLVNGGLGVLDTIVPSHVLARMDDATGGGLKKAALGMLGETGQGAWTEAVQQYGADLYAQGTFDPDRDLAIGEAAGAGGFAGAFISALGSGARAARKAGVKPKPAEAPAPEPSASFTEEPVAQPSGETGGLDLTGNAAPFAEQVTTNEVLKPVEVSSSEQPQAVEPAPDAGSRREQTPAAFETPPVPQTLESARPAAEAELPEAVTYPRIVVAEMPKGEVLGTDLTGEPVYSKVERGDLKRPGADVPKPKVTQPGIFDEVGGLFEAQAYGTEEAPAPKEPPKLVVKESPDDPGHEPTTEELVAHPDVRRSLQSLADEAGDEGVGGQLIRGESDNLGSGRGSVVGRTRKTARAEWWNRRPNNATEAAVKRTVRKVLAGEALSASDQELADWLVREAANQVPVEVFSEYQNERDAIQNEGKYQRTRDRDVPFDAPDPVGIKHKSTEKLRIEYGLPEYEGRTPKPDEELKAAARKKFEEDAFAGQDLIQRLEGDGKLHNDEEGMLLLFESNRLANERDAAQDAYNADPTPENQARVDFVTAQYDRAAAVLERTGSEWGAAGRVRQFMMARDYSFAAQERKRMVANGGEKLSAAETAELKKQTDRIKELEAQLAEVSSKEEERAKKEALKKATKNLDRARDRVQRERQRDTGRKQARSRIEKNLARLAELARTAHSNIPSKEAIKVAGEVALDHIRLGLYKFSDFADAVVKSYGEKIRPHLQGVWNDQIKAYRAELADPLKERLKSGAKLSELRRYVDQLTESFHADGFTDAEKLADAVHSVLKEADPKITRDETVAAIAHYGDFKRLTQDEAKRELRGIRGELRESSKLADLAKGIPPKKTGVEYPEPTSRQRRLAKKVREEMKRLGIRTTDAATQIKSTLESAKTRQRNAIDDLTTAIDTRTQIKQGQRVEVSDAELVELKKQRAEKQAIYDEMFAEPVKSQSEKDIERISKEVAELERRIKAGEIAQKGGKQGPDIAEVARLKAERARLNDQLAEMRKQVEPNPSNTERQIKLLEKRAEKVRALIFDVSEGGDASARGAKQGPDVERVAELKRELASLNSTLADIRDAQNPGLTDEQRSILAHERAAQRRLEKMQARMRSGDFDPVKTEKEERIKSPAEIETLTELALTKRIVDRGTYEARKRNRTRWQKAKDFASEAIQLPKAYKSAFDVSAVLRQGLPFTVAHPFESIRHTRRMFRALASEDYAQKLDTEIRNRPMAALGEKAGLELTSMNDEPGKHEEAIYSNFSEKIPGVRISNRAFVAYLNMQRAARFDAMAAALGPGTPIEHLKQVAAFVNTATGRGNVGKGKIGRIITDSSAFLWAPRLYVSRFQLLVPVLPGGPAYQSNAHARRIVAGYYARWLTAAAAFYGSIALYNSWNDDDDDDIGLTFDPTNTDFGKLVVGRTRIDPLGGLAQNAVFIGRESKAIIERAMGDKKTQLSPLEIAARFGGSKFSPTFTVPYQLAVGRDIAYDRERSRLETTLQTVLPGMSMLDIYEAMQDQGVPTGLAAGVLAAFGMGVSVHEDKKK